MKVVLKESCDKSVILVGGIEVDKLQDYTQEFLIDSILKTLKKSLEDKYLTVGCLLALLPPESCVDTIDPDADDDHSHVTITTWQV